MILSVILFIAIIASWYMSPCEADTKGLAEFPDSVEIARLQIARFNKHGNNTLIGNGSSFSIYINETSYLY